MALNSNMEQPGERAFEPLPIALASELRMIREHMKLSQEEIAKLVGVTNFTWWRWEQGRQISEHYTAKVRKLYEKHLEAVAARAAANVREFGG